MTVFIQTDATGGGGGTVNGTQGQVDLAIAVGGDTGFGVGAAVGNRQPVTYGPTLAGVTMTRVDALVNTAFSPDYGSGAQAVPIVILPVGSNFTLNDGTLITTVGGTALPPSNSGLAGAGLNNTTDCLVIYDTSDANGAGYCTARDGTGGTLDLPMPTSVMLYHELSHAFRIVNNTLLTLTGTCNPASPEESAAITDENDLRTLNANSAGVPVVLRDPNIHCGSAGPCGGTGGCCIIASVATGSPVSDEVKALRYVRDRVLRPTETGFAFFQRFFHDYYSFSPQVCTLMAKRPDLSKLVLEGFVQPLVVIMRLLQHYAVDACSDVELGRRLSSYHRGPAEAAAALETLERANTFWLGSIAAGDDDDLRELGDLLQMRAWPSEHIQWSLIEPLRIYASALKGLLEGRKATALGRALRNAFTAWAAEVPLDHVWASFSASELRKELQIFEGRLLRAARPRQRFRERLRERFGGVTAIDTVIGRRSALQEVTDG